MTDPVSTVYPEDAIKSFLSQSGNESLAQVDYFRIAPHTAVDKTIRTYSRLQKLTSNEDVSRRLLAEGISSAAQIALAPERTFVTGAAARAGLSTEQARGIHQNAVRIHNRTMQLFAATHGAVASPHLRSMRVIDSGQEIAQHFETLPSYQEMFGSLNFCGCEECKSIFGPAAYFVDLMRIIDLYITQPNQATIPAPFLLQARRPDLWDLQLSCEMTNNTVAYLQIVNERLSDAAIRTLKISNQDPPLMQQMAEGLVYPLTLPFNYPLDRVRVLSQQVAVALSDIYAAWSAGAGAVVRERVGLSPTQLDIITNATSDTTQLGKLYGVDASGLAGLSQVARFLDRTGLTVTGLTALIDQNLSTEEIAANVPMHLFVNQKLGTAFLRLSPSADQTTSTIQNLNNIALDQINRLRRLAAALGWSAETTDWCLRAATAGADPTIDPKTLAALDRIARFAAAFELTPIQASVMFGPIKTYGGDGTDPMSPFDRLFNDPATVASPYRPKDNPLNPTYGDALNWTPGSTDAANVAAINRVSAGLGLALPAANALGIALYGTTQQALSVDVLSALYRHAVLSRLLGLTMSDYLTFLALQGGVKALFAGQDLDDLVSRWQWMNDVDLDVPTLDYVLRGHSSPFVDPLFDANAVPAWQLGLPSLVPDPTAVDAQMGLTRQVAVLFNAGVELMTPCLALAVAAVPTASGGKPAVGTAWVGLFLDQDPTTRTASLAYVGDVLRLASRWLVLAQAVDLSAALLGSVASYPAAYGLGVDAASIGLDAIRGIQSVAALGRRFGDRRNDLLRYVALSQQTAPASADDPQFAALKDATGWDPAQAYRLVTTVATAIAVPDRLRQFAICFDQMTAFGGDVSFMQGLAGLAAPKAWSDYVAQEALCQAKVAGRFGAQRWQQMAGPVEGKLQVRLRDALLGLELAALHAAYDDIKTPNNLYEFLLTDVETGPEAQISYLKEGLNAVQLYLQRCRLRLEPGVDILDIPPAFWDWMMNYRVWEANRRIFLYPENYLQPSLRRDQTSLFNTLSNNLRQSEITSAYVESIYTDYIDAFGEVARLKPIEAYRCTVDDRKGRGKVKTLFLLARTGTAPFTFYICSQPEAAPWSEWTKIDLTINAPSVTPLYAFGRLFLFWVEIKTESSPSIKVGTTGGQTNNDRVHRATIQYSFMNHQDEWVAAQTLAKDVVVLFEGQGGDAVTLAKDPLFTGCFDLDQIPWGKVFALNVSGGNWPGGKGPIGNGGRIVVGFGPYLRDVTGAQSANDTPASQDAAAFIAELQQRVAEHELGVSGRLSGELALNGFWVLDSDLLANYVGHNAELLLLDPYVPGVPLNQFTPNLDELNLRLQLVRTPSPVTDNYLADVPDYATAPVTPTQVSSAFFASELGNTGAAADAARKVFAALVAAQVLNNSGTISPSAMASLDLTTALGSLLGDGTITTMQLPGILRVLLQNMGSTVLFSAVNSSNARVITLKNQPGWFLLNNGDETFLLQPKAATDTTVVFSALEDGLMVSQPPLNNTSFVIPNTTPVMGSDISAQIFSLFQQYSAIDERGMPQFDTIAKLRGIENILGNMFLTKALSKDQIPMIDGILHNYPQVFDDAFKSDRINSDTSKTIYQLMQEYALIDGNQRLHPEFLTGDFVTKILANLIMQGGLAQKDAATVYRILVRAAVPYTFSYWNQGDTSSFATLAAGRFIVTRLTTAAVQPLSRALFAGGIDRLLSLESQDIPVTPVLPFDRLRPTNDNIIWPNAIDGAQVDYDGLYGRYFQEIFFHGPMLVANALSANLQFSDALSWFHYVFDPTIIETFITATTFSDESSQAISPPASKEAFDTLKTVMIGSPAAPILDAQGRVNPGLTPTTDLKLSTTSFTPVQMQMVLNILLNHQLASPASRFWLYRPFRTHSLEKLRDILTDGSDAMKAYEDDPFDPFAIARLRIGAFEKATVMQYIDTLIQWGDFYFAQDTWEAIVAATMLYVYASDLLGPRPEQVGICSTSPPATFARILEVYKNKPVPEFLLDLETHVPAPGPAVGDALPVAVHAFNDLGTYFCVPENDVFTGYWDRVDDRLSKIRHSQNIKGQFRLLALFEPPIDPLALIRAAGASANFLPVGSAGSKVIPPYRFQAALDRARRFAASTAQLGAALQAALEVKDGEALALLRNTHEGQILAATTQIKQNAITRATASVAALTASQKNAQAQLDHYTNLLDVGLSDSETLNLTSTQVSLVFSLAASILKTASSIGYAVPQVGSPFAMTYGGVQLGSIVDAASGAAQVGADIANFIAQRALTMAGYERRDQDWTLAKTVAQNECDGLTQQIAAANADLAASQQDLVAHQKSIAQNLAIDTFLRGKFTNQDLYQWIAGRIAAIYFQSYQAAVRAALAAQQSFQYETDTNQTFIAFDYWDGGHRGLHAADGLVVALDAMEAAYAAGNTRRLEIERTISLAALSPTALFNLKTGGTCSFDIPELLFDYDYPGHYARKLQSVTLSIPAVVGPYQNIKAMLTQTKSAVAASNDFANVEYLIDNSKKQPTSVLIDLAADNRQIAVSRGIDDSGMFVLDFRDERYLPFEGTGAVSSWRLDMPRETNRFDFAQLSDVVITLRYTALADDDDGDNGLKAKVETLLANKYPLAAGYYVPVQQSFPLQWRAFMADRTTTGSQTLTFSFTPAWLGYLSEMTLSGCSLRLTVDPSIDLTNAAPVVIGTLQWAQTGKQDLTLSNGVASVTIPKWKRDSSGGPWQIVFDLQKIQQSKDLATLVGSDGWLDAGKLLDVEILLDCRVKLFST